MKLGDKILLFIVLVAVVGFFSYNYFSAQSSDKLTVVIKQNGEILKEFNLDKNTDYQETFEWNGHTNTVRIKDNTVKVVESDCNDQVCVKQGQISRKGESIICLPNRFVIEIKSTGDSDVDYIIK